MWGGGERGVIISQREKEREKKVHTMNTDSLLTGSLPGGKKKINSKMV